MIKWLQLFWDWWREQLLDLVPGRMARRDSRADDGVLISDLADDGPEVSPSLHIAERQQGQETPLGRVRLEPEVAESIRAGALRRALPIVLQLPHGLLLEREVSVPIAAERELGQVLFHEMDRFTPFAAPEVYWSYTIAGRDRTLGKLQVRLSLVLRGPLEPLIARVRGSGLPVSCLELDTALGEVRRIGLDEAATRKVTTAWLPAVAGCAALLALTVAVPFLMQSRAMAAAERRIAADMPMATRVQELRRAASASATGSEVVAAERSRAGDALEAFALLTNALPDDTYLTALTYDAGKLTMDGQSQSAAALIAPLTANPRLRDASFTAPVVRNTLGADSFSMRLRVTR